MKPTFGPADNDLISDMATRLAQGEPHTDAEVWQLVERIEQDRVRIIDLVAALRRSP
jgi:hypothetical protein